MSGIASSFKRYNVPVVEDDVDELFVTVNVSKVSQVLNSAPVVSVKTASLSESVQTMSAIEVLSDSEESPMFVKESDPISMYGQLTSFDVSIQSELADLSGTLLQGVLSSSDDVVIESALVDLNEITIEGVLADSGISQSFTIYDGAYEVTPTTYEQGLPTASRILTANVVIHKIPYVEVDNSAGGLTVTIA